MFARNIDRMELMETYQIIEKRCEVCSTWRKIRRQRILRGRVLSRKSKQKVKIRYYAKRERGCVYLTGTVQKIHNLWKRGGGKQCEEEGKGKEKGIEKL